jgi:hypothetical protein
MDFEGAIMAMVDEEQTDAVKAFFDKLSDLYIAILDRYLTHYTRRLGQPEGDILLPDSRCGNDRATHEESHRFPAFQRQVLRVP